MMDMAVGVIIGGAFSGLVESLTNNFINPILNFVTGAATYNLQDIAGFGSTFVSALVNFLIMAFVLFCLLKEATRCPHCTSVLEEAKETVQAEAAAAAEA